MRAVSIFSSSATRKHIFLNYSFKIYKTHVSSLLDIYFPNMNKVPVHPWAHPIAHERITDQQRTAVLLAHKQNEAGGARASTHRVHPHTATNQTDRSCKLHSAQPSEINVLTSKEIEYEKWKWRQANFQAWMHIKAKLRHYTKHTITSIEHN